MHSGIDDYDIQALVDGELEPDEARRVKRKIVRNPVLQECYDEIVHQKILSALRAALK